MSRIVQVASKQQVTAADIDAIGTLQREAEDFLVQDVVGTEGCFAGFPIVSPSATTLTVGAGRLFTGGQVYANADPGGVAIDLLGFLPNTLNNTRIVSVVGYGNGAQDDGIEPRTFVTDVTTRATEARQTATRSTRRAVIELATGSTEAPTPGLPPIAANYVEIARITLGTSGVLSIAMIEANRQETIDRLDARATAIEATEAATGKQVATLRSDLSNLAAAIVGLPSPNIFQQIVHTIAQVIQRVKVPAAALNFHQHNFLTQSATNADPASASFLCRIQEGVRFAWAAQQISYLALFNPLEPRVKAGSGTGLMLPDWTEAARIDTIGKDGELSISQYQSQNITARQKSLSRQVVNWGTSFTKCQNSQWWQDGSYDINTGVFTRNGEMFNVVLADANIAYGTGHTIYRLQQFWTTTVDDTYWAYVVTNVSANGALLSQTFLNSQAGWLTSIDVAFTRVAASGDVTLLLCETSNGQPDYKSVIASVTVPAAKLQAYPATTNFPLKPTYLDPGARYAVVLVSNGNHFVATRANNKYAQGSLFYSTDGAWSQGDLTTDLAFRANFAKFGATVAQLLMTPLQLQNGITDVQLLYASKIPDGCEIIWEVNKGDGIWYPMKSYGTNHPLLGLPPLLQLRLTFVGTTDLMPGIDMTQTQTIVSRPRGDLTWVPPPIAIGAPSSNIRVEQVVDSFDPAHHTTGCKLTIAGGDVAPAATTTVLDTASSTGRRTITYTFALGAPTSTFTPKFTGTTDNVTNIFHIESEFDYEA